MGTLLVKVPDYTEAKMLCIWAVSWDVWVENFSAYQKEQNIFSVV